MEPPIHPIDFGRFETWDLGQKLVKYALKTVIHKSLGPPNLTHPHLGYSSQINRFFTASLINAKGEFIYGQFPRIDRVSRFSRRYRSENCSHYVVKNVIFSQGISPKVIITIQNLYLKVHVKSY